MNIYLIKLIECTYDEYDAFVVCAESEVNALKLVKCNRTKDEAMEGYMNNNQYDKNVESITMIGTSTTGMIEHVVLSSFNAG